MFLGIPKGLSRQKYRKNKKHILVVSYETLQESSACSRRTFCVPTANVKKALAYESIQLLGRQNGALGGWATGISREA